jgi:hypothetical protein
MTIKSPVPWFYGDIAEAWLARVEQTVERWRAGKVEKQDAVDELQQDAEHQGLVTQYGQHIIQEVFASVFGQPGGNGQQNGTSKKDLNELLQIAGAGAVAKSMAVAAEHLRIKREYGRSTTSQILAQIRQGRRLDDNVANEIRLLIKLEPDAVGSISAELESLGMARDQIAALLNGAPLGAPPAHIVRMNERYAIVRRGANVLVLLEEDGKPPSFMSVVDFKTWTANEEKIRLNKSKLVPLAQAWIEHSQRRQYSGVVFDPRDQDPRNYNLWRGFAVAPDPSKSCNKFLAHVRDNVAGGDEEIFKWLLAFFAHIVQRPWELPEVAVALRGPEGAGKGIVFRMIGKLMPQHFVTVSQEAHLTGRFNVHFAQCLLLFADEAFWAGSRAGEGVLKQLITEPEILIEAKFLNPIMIRNLVRLVIASNERWIVPAGLRARRWAVLDVPPSHAGDREYFGAIVREMEEEGGLAGLMYVLSTFDLEAVNLQQVPETRALFEQKQETLKPQERWWFECLTDGCFRYEVDDGHRKVEEISWPLHIPKRTLWQSFKYFSESHRYNIRLWPSSTLLQWLRDYLPADPPEMRPRTATGDRDRMWKLPDLQSCRKKFAEKVGQAIHWGDDVDANTKARSDTLPF